MEAMDLKLLTKHQLKQLLLRCGASTAGPKSALYTRLTEEICPRARTWKIEVRTTECVGNEQQGIGGRDPKRSKTDGLEIYDQDGNVIDLSSSEFKVEMKVVKEQPKSMKPIQERFPKARVLTAGLPNDREQVLKAKVRREPSHVHHASDCSTSHFFQLSPQLINELSTKFTVILGRSGTGRSVTLSQFRSASKRFAIEWDKSRAVVSQFADAESARKWLLAVGLTSIPSWCKPYHILSTGERYRAHLARLLEASSKRRECIILDDFANHLDRRSAKCCAVAFGRQVRKMHEIGCVVSCNNVDIVPWLRPDLIVCTDSREVVRLKSGLKYIGPDVKIRISRKDVIESLEMKSEPGPRSISQRFIGRAKLETLRNSFRHNPEDESTRTGGTVLQTMVNVDEATKMCDALFDNAFTGEQTLHVPHMPDESELGDFDCGLIVGASGSAKSVLLQVRFGPPTKVEWDDCAPVLAHFSSDEEGLESLRCILGHTYQSEHIGARRFPDLSRSQQEIANLARLIGVQNIRVDEYTSSMDRDLAKAVSNRVGKYLMGKRRKAVFVSCHDDIVEHLNPSWVFHTQTYAIEKRGHKEIEEHTGKELRPLREQLSFDPSGMLARPGLELNLHRCEPWVWSLFRDHHYKTSHLSEKAETFVLIHNSSELVGFIAMIPQVGFREESEILESKRARGAWRAHRTVVLPTWQGLGIGSRLSDAGAEIFRQLGCTYLAQTVHPRFGQYRDHSPFWIPTKWNHTTSEFKIENWKQRLENVRVKLLTPKFLYSHQYVGPQNEDQQKLLASRVQILD